MVLRSRTPLGSSARLMCDAHTNNTRRAHTHTRIIRSSSPVTTCRSPTGRSRPPYFRVVTSVRRRALSSLRCRRFPVCFSGFFSSSPHACPIVNRFCAPVAEDVKKVSHWLRELPVRRGPDLDNSEWNSRASYWNSRPSCRHFRTTLLLHHSFCKEHVVVHTMSAGYRSGNMPGEVLFQWFSCCVNQRTQQGKRGHVRQVRIDRSMIGVPTNFQHTLHLGTSDVEMGSSRLHAIHGQMQSKGGYEASVEAN